MRKTLCAIGNSYGLILDKPVLELLHISKDTELDISTDGERLIVAPVRKGQTKDATSSARRLMAVHKETLKKLAT